MSNSQAYNFERLYREWAKDRAARREAATARALRAIDRRDPDPGTTFLWLE